MNVWNFVSGYVKICIMGKYPERLVNAALVNGISVFSACNTDNGIICTVAAGDIQRLRASGRGCGCRIRILSRHGLVFKLRPLKFEPLLLALAALLVTAAVLMSRRLWFIKIDCGGMDRSAVLSELEIAGVRRGSLLRSISPSELSSLLSDIPGVASADVELHGIVLSVSLSEGTGYGMPSESFELPREIRAAKDCVLTDITVLSGRALVSIGDNVSAGQTIISGDMSGLKEGYYVPAAGEAYGKVMYRTSASSERTSTSTQWTGASVELSAAKLFGSSYLIGLPFNEYKLEPKKAAVLDACFLPVTIESFICMELGYTVAEADEQIAVENAVNEALQKLYSAVPAYAKILSVGTEYRINEDGSVTAEASAVVIEKISD